MTGKNAAGPEAHNALRRSRFRCLLASRRTLWIALALAAACQPAANGSPSSPVTAEPLASDGSPTATMEVTVTSLESQALADAELKTSAPYSWGRRSTSGARSAPSSTTPDGTDNQTEAPPCTEVDFPVDTGEELVWESFDSDRGGSPLTGVPDPAPASDGQHKIAALYLPRDPNDPQELLIVHTDDEGTASTHTVRLSSSEGLHPLLQTSSDVGDVVVTPERWFIGSSRFSVG